MAITGKQVEVLNDKDTIVIFPANGVESELARTFLVNNAPKVASEDRMFDTLELTMLAAKMKVAFVYRAPKTPAMKYILQVDGTKTHELRPERELMDEMRVFGPFEPAFTRDGPAKPYKLSVARFLEDVGAALEGMRLDFIDKGEPRPQVMQLSYT
jgi:hypothetical protein